MVMYAEKLKPHRARVLDVFDDELLHRLARLQQGSAYTQTFQYCY